MKDRVAKVWHITGKHRQKIQYTYMAKQQKSNKVLNIVGFSLFFGVRYIYKGTLLPGPYRAVLMQLQEKKG